MLDPPLATQLQHMAKRCDVVVEASLRVVDGVANARLSRQVHDGINLKLLQPCLQRSLIGEVELQKVKALHGLQQRQAVQLQLRDVVGVQVIDPHHSMPALQQFLDNIHADETGTARDQNSGHKGSQVNTRGDALGSLGSTSVDLKPKDMAVSKLLK